jgi:hypothetical protein
MILPQTNRTYQQSGEPLFEEQAVEAVQGILPEMDLRVTNLTALILAPA